MKTYRQSMDELHFTQEEKRELADRLMAGEVRRPGRVRSLRRTVAVGAAAALLMTMGAGAAMVLTPAGEVFASVFGGSPAQTEIVDQMGMPIGASDTDGGVTITADAIIGDTYSYAVVYSIARDDGQPLAEDLEPIDNTGGLLPLTFEQSDTYLGVMGGAHGSGYFYDADPADNAVQYVEMMTLDTPIEPGVATAKFQNLYLHGEDMERIPLAEGKWKLRFQFQFPDSGVSLEAGQTFQLNGMEAALDAVTISPLSIQVDYTVREQFQMEDQENGKMSASNSAQVKKFLSSLPISVNFTDGTSRDFTSLGGSVDPEEGKTVCQKGGVFGEILDLSAVESVTVGGVTLPVEAE